MLVFFYEMHAVIIVKRKRRKKLYLQLFLHANLLLSDYDGADGLPEKVLSEMKA